MATNSIMDGKFIKLVKTQEQHLSHPIYEITNKSHGDCLARICWYGRWRCYVCEFNPHAVFNDQCLSDVQRFLKHLREAGEAKTKPLAAAERVIEACEKVVIVNEHDDGCEDGCLCLLCEHRKTALGRIAAWREAGDGS